MRMPHPGWICCFCYEKITEVGDEPVELFVRGARDQSEQALFSHLDCFTRALHPRIPVGIALHEDEGEGNQRDE